MLTTTRSAGAPSTTHGPPGWAEATAGAILVLLVLLGGLVVWIHPGPNFLDRWGFALFPVARNAPNLLHIAALSSPPAAVAGSLLAAVLAVRDDRRRAAACLLGPLIASLAVEWLLKPVVGRRYLGVLCFPSGSVTVIAATCTALVLAVSRCWLRWTAIAVATVVVVSVAVAVVGLRWHYPSDALAGAMFGTGVVLLLDGVLHMIGRPVSPGA